MTTEETTSSATTPTARGHHGTERPQFAFRSVRGSIHGPTGSTLPRGPVTTLGARVASFFDAPAQRGALLVGALPFAREAEDWLVEASASPMTVADWPARPWPALRWTLRHDPDASRFATSVQQALDVLEAERCLPEGVRKVVLSRTLHARASAPIPLDALLERLCGDPLATGFLVPLPPRAGEARVLAGASPELLLSKDGDRISSHPLAGSRRREREPAADATAATELARSDKDRREHALVLEHVLDTLAPYCGELATPQGTVVVGTRTMWHLGTWIQGKLKNPRLSSAELAGALHPTPAVCGLPRARAADLIGELESHDRDFYAGAVGWCDAAGDGSWYVAIRCAEVAGHEARLYAGAGIVTGSDPWAEAAETSAKYAAVLVALGIELPETSA